MRLASTSRKFLFCVYQIQALCQIGELATRNPQLELFNKSKIK